MNRKATSSKRSNLRFIFIRKKTKRKLQNNHYFWFLIMFLLSIHLNFSHFVFSSFNDKIHTRRFTFLEFDSCKLNSNQLDQLDRKFSDLDYRKKKKKTRKFSDLDYTNVVKHKFNKTCESCKNWKKWTDFFFKIVNIDQFLWSLSFIFLTIFFFV